MCTNPRVILPNPPTKEKMVTVAVRYLCDLSIMWCELPCLTEIKSVDKIQTINSATGKPPYLLFIGDVVGYNIVA